MEAEYNRLIKEAGSSEIDGFSKPESSVDAILNESAEKDVGEASFRVVALPQKDTKKRSKAVDLAEKEKHLAKIKEKRTQELETLLERSEFFASYFSTIKEDVDAKPRSSKRIMESRNRKRSHQEMRRSSSPEEASTSGEAASPTRTTALGFVVSKEQPLLLDGAIMRDYQLAGLKWMKRLYLSGMNGILADEMGLGKTIQVISLICHLYEKGVSGPFLVIGPLSTLSNWSSELETFASQIPVLLYHGNIEERILLRKKIARKYKIGEKPVFPVVLTSFEMQVADVNLLNKYNWAFIFVDEGHRLKNPNSLFKKTMQKMSSVNRMILTGTPIQNSLEELWSLLNFLLPTCFNSLEMFESWLSVEEILSMDSKGSESFLEKEKEEKVIEKMHKILQPFILRRVKADVNLMLPGKKEVIIDCPLTKFQLEWYIHILNLNADRKLEKVELDNCIGKRLLRSQVKKKETLLTPAIQLKHFRHIPSAGRRDFYIDQRDGQEYHINLKMAVPFKLLLHIVNHPFIFTIPVAPGGDTMFVDKEKIIETSGKMFILDSLLKRLKASGHKVLLFSTSVMFLDIIEMYLNYVNYSYHVLNGNTKIDERKRRIADFNMNPDSFIFLISTRAGGLGINLCAADTVIIINSDWNPQVDLQAQDRCHRIGQTRPVVVYRLRVSGTVDEGIFQRALAKRKLEKVIIQKGNFGTKEEKNNLSFDELKAILEEKIAANEMLIGNKDFSEEKWSKLLDRSDLSTIDQEKEGYVVV